MAWVIIGLSTWLIMLPPLIFLAIDKPEDVSIKPDGILENNKESKNNKKFLVSI